VATNFISAEQKKIDLDFQFRRRMIQNFCLFEPELFIIMLGWQFDKVAMKRLGLAMRILKNCI